MDADGNQQCESTSVNATAKTYSTSAPTVQEYSESSLALASPGRSVAYEFGIQFGVAQVMDNALALDIIDRLEKAEVYMRDQVQVDPKYAKVRNTCRNQHESCTFWAVLGEVSVLCGLCACVCVFVCCTADRLSTTHAS
jgi:hypothetical protein